MRAPYLLVHQEDGLGLLSRTSGNLEREGGAEDGLRDEDKVCWEAEVHSGSKEGRVHEARGVPGVEEEVFRDKEREPGVEEEVRTAEG